VGVVFNTALDKTDGVNVYENAMSSLVLGIDDAPKKRIEHIRKEQKILRKF